MGGSLEDQHHYYMGEGDEEKFDRVDEIFITTEEATPPKFGPRVEISKEKCVSLFAKWRGALIIKLLGKAISYSVLDQRASLSYVFSPKLIISKYWKGVHGLYLNTFYRSQSGDRNSDSLQKALLPPLCGLNSQKYSLNY